MQALAAPIGSFTSDEAYPISNELLSLLSASMQSSLLSVVNIGAATTSKVNKTLEILNSLSSIQTYLLNGSLLDNLANGSSSAAFTMTNIESWRAIRIVIILGSVTPIGSPQIEITSGDLTYSIAVSDSPSVKRVEFNEIPASFASGFVVKNKTGVAFAPYGNSVVVVGL